MTHVSCVPAATDLADFNFHAFTGPDEKPRSFIQTDSLFSAHSGLQSQRPEWSGRTLWDFALLCFDYFVVSSFMFDSLKTENSQTVILIGGSPNTVVLTVAHNLAHIVLSLSIMYLSMYNDSFMIDQMHSWPCMVISMRRRVITGYQYLRLRRAEKSGYTRPKLLRMADRL